MKALLLPALLALLIPFSLGACSDAGTPDGDPVAEQGAGDGEGTPAAGDDGASECICGTTRADLLGCPCDLCANGENNPDNPDCFCGSINVGGDQ